MTPDQYDALKRMLVADEALRLFPYVDTKKKITIGIGRNLTDRGITESEANYLYENDVQIAVTGLTRELPWFLRVDPARQRVLINIAFNAGVDGLLKFHRMLEAARTGDFNLAAEEIIRSQIAPVRAQRLAAVMRAGDAA